MSDYLAFSTNSIVSTCLSSINEVHNLFGSYLEFFARIGVGSPSKKLGKTLLTLRDELRYLDNPKRQNYETSRILAYLAGDLPHVLNDVRQALNECRLKSDDRRYSLEDLLDSFEDIVTVYLERLKWAEITLKIFCRSLTLHIDPKASESCNHEQHSIQNSAPRSARPRDCQNGDHKYVDVSKNSRHLRILINGFFNGHTIQRNAKSPADNSSKYHTAKKEDREKGLDISRRLQDSLEEVLNERTQLEDVCLWKIGSSFYWLSKSLEELETWESKYAVEFRYHTLQSPQSGWEDLAEIFFDAIKAGWLLDNVKASGPVEGHSPVLKRVILCASDTTFELLDSFYRERFSMPKYGVIQEYGNFELDTPFRKVPSDTNSSASARTSPSTTTSSFSSRPLEPVQVSSELLGDSQFPVKPIPPLIPTRYREPQSFATRERTRPEEREVTEDVSGLMITAVEFGQSEDEKQNSSDLELFNEEAEDPQATRGFHHAISSKQMNSPVDEHYKNSQVRIFRSDRRDDTELRMITFRRDSAPQHSIVNRNLDRLVPLYTFEGSGTNGSEMYISHQGMPATLKYKFETNDRLRELYGFQGALTGSFFNSDHAGAVQVSLKEAKSSTLAMASFPRLQIWTNNPDFHRPCETQREQPDARKEISVLTRKAEEDMVETKLFIFSHDVIYTLFSA